MDPAQIDAVARGRVWTGRQARDVGLVDAVGGFRDALRIAKEKAGIAPDREVSLVVLPEQPNFLQSLFRGTNGVGAQLRAGRPDPLEALGALFPGGNGALAELLNLAPLLASGEPLALLPFQVDVR